MGNFGLQNLFAIHRADWEWKEVDKNVLIVSPRAAGFPLGWIPHGLGTPHGCGYGSPRECRATHARIEPYGDGAANGNQPTTGSHGSNMRHADATMAHVGHLLDPHGSHMDDACASLATWGRMSDLMGLIPILMVCSSRPIGTCVRSRTSMCLATLALGYLAASQACSA